MAYDSNLRLACYLIAAMLMILVLLGSFAVILIARQPHVPGQQQEQTVPCKWPRSVRYA